MFKDFLRTARESVSLSQEALAIKLDISKPAVQNWERGECYPGHDKILPLAAALNISSMSIYSEILKDFSYSAGTQNKFAIFSAENTPSDCLPLSSLRWNPLLGVDPYVFSEKLAKMSGSNNVPKRSIADGVRVLQRLDEECGVEGKYTTLLTLERLLQNLGGQGLDLIQKFSRISLPTLAEAVESRNIADWFLNQYLQEGSRFYEAFGDAPEEYLLHRMNTHPILRVVLNPDVDMGERSTIPNEGCCLAAEDCQDAEWVERILNQLAECGANKRCA